MNLLHRVFYGRVAKKRPASTNGHQGNKMKASSLSPTQSHQVRSSSQRAGSAITVPNTAEASPPQNRHSHQFEASYMPRPRIKEEDEIDAIPTFPRQGDHSGVTADIGQPDGYIARSNESTQNACLATIVKSESREAGSSKWHADEGAYFDRDTSDADVEPDEDEDAAEELYTTGRDYFNSDEPIPSIEEGDGDIGELERPQHRKRTPPFLHGTTHRPDRSSESNPESGGDGGVEDEGFEQELGGEAEENLLIDDNDLRHWLHHKRSTAGIQSWPSEACRLYKLLFLRGLYPVFGSQWTWNFLDHPMPGELFTPLGSDEKCLLKAEKSNYHASKALIRLFNLYGHVSDFRLCGMQEKIAPLIEREIKRYVLWAERDGNFVKKHDYVSPVFVITYKDAQAASTGQPIVERCQALVKKYRSLYAARGIRDYPRCIYIFVVVQHVVLVMLANTEQLDEKEPYPLAELDLSQRSHWLDSSLGIAIAVMLAKESLLAHRWAFPTIQVVEDDLDR